MERTLKPIHPILLIDDEEQFLTSVKITLATNGLNHVETLSDPTQALGLLARKEYSLVVLDIIMPKLSGDVLLEKIAAGFPQLPVLMLSALSDLSTAVDCIRKGASNYLIKPVSEKQFVSEVTNLLRIGELRRENEALAEKLMSPGRSREFFQKTYVTQSEKILPLFDYLDAIAASPLPVLITGETGVGKDVFARLLHAAQVAQSPSRKETPYVSVNIGGLDDNLFSDTLFGHKKGAFTGADTDRKGLIEQAENGVIFLDEIGELGESSQVKLLRLLQQGEYFPLGTDQPRRTNARIILATNKDLHAQQEAGKFRKDLYYRLKTHRIYIPPLRERKEDIVLLAEHLVRKSAEQMKKSVPEIPPEVLDLLTAYNYPGNVRELESILHEAVTLQKDGKVSAAVVKNFMSENQMERGASAPEGVLTLSPGKFPTLKSAGEFLVQEALKRANQNQSLAAQMLGISRQALYLKLQGKKKGNAEEE